MNSIGVEQLSVNPPQGSSTTPRISSAVIAGSARTAEFLIAMLCGAGSYAVLVSPEQPFTVVAVAVILVVAAAAVWTFDLLGYYRIAAFRLPLRGLAPLIVAWATIFLITLVAVVTFQSGIRISSWMAGWFAAGLVGLLTGRFCLRVLVYRWALAGRLTRRCAIVGGGREGEALLRALAEEKNSDLQICGVFDDRAEDRSPSVLVGVPKLGTLNDLVQFTRQTRVDLVIVALPVTAEERVLQMMRKLWVLPVDIRLAAHMSRLHFRPQAYSYIGSIPVLPLADRPLTDWNIVVKNMFDRIVGALLIIGFSPVLLAAAIAIKIDTPGPILFRQRRFGFNNEVIEVLKFRSLYQEHSDLHAHRSVTKGDPRVTPVGRFIRKMSIDELPQLLNVLRGELSLVGPRPHALAAPMEKMWEEVVDAYFARHRMKPGLTGWAQINGWRGGTRHTREASASCRARSLLH